MSGASGQGRHRETDDGMAQGVLPSNSDAVSNDRGTFNFLVRTAAVCVRVLNVDGRRFMALRITAC